MIVPVPRHPLLHFHIGLLNCRSLLIWLLLGDNCSTPKQQIEKNVPSKPEISQYRLILNENVAYNLEKGNEAFNGVFKIRL